jgi:drug/metabolite transporter (DMT)-like permease
MIVAPALSPGLMLIGLGLAASALWGASDFFGGLATRRTHVVVVVSVAHTLSLIMLLLLVLLRHTPSPGFHFAFMGLFAGACGGIALLLYYQALSLGKMGLTTALTGLLTALVPVVFSFLTQGWPKHTQVAGFVLAAGAITLIAYAPGGGTRPLALGLAAVAGLAFGVFLVVLQIAGTHSAVWQLIYSRIASSALAASLLLWLQWRGPRRAAAWWREPGNKRYLWVAAGAGVLEATGSLLYMLSARHGRLDVAAVLASLYPVVTILLAAWFLKERTTPAQAVGMALALGAVVLVSI